MARTTLTKTSGLGPNPTNATLLVETAADTVNFNQFAWTGREVLIIHNTHATTTYTYTVTSVADPYGRSGDITAQNILAGEIKFITPLDALGWKQTDGMIYVAANNVAVKFGIITLP